MSVQPLRRFNTLGQNRKVRELTPDPHGTFMLWTDHSMAISALQKELQGMAFKLRHAEEAVERAEREVQRVRAEVTEGRGKPQHWAVKARGKVLGTFPTQALANAAALVLAYDKGIATTKMVLMPLWEPA